MPHAGLFFYTLECQIRPWRNFLLVSFYLNFLFANSRELANKKSVKRCRGIESLWRQAIKPSCTIHYSRDRGNSVYHTSLTYLAM